MKLNHILLALLFFVFTLSVHAQNKVGDNPAVIQAGSLLELESLTKGLRLPRIPLNDATKWTLDGVAASGMMIYNESGTEPKGIYYWSTESSKWVKVINKDELPSLIDAFNKLNTTVINTSAGNLLQTNVNGITGAPVNLVNSNSLYVTSNKLTSKVNGVPAEIIFTPGVIKNTIGLTSSGNIAMQDSRTLSIANSIINDNDNNITTTVNNETATAKLITENKLVGENSTITSTVNGVSALLTPSAGMLDQVIGFSSGGNMVRQVVKEIPIKNEFLGENFTLATKVNGQYAPLTFGTGDLTSMIGFDVNGKVVKSTTNNALALVNGNLTSTVNGLISNSVSVVTSANNGIGLSSGEVQLGGSLNKSTIINTSTFPLTIQGANKLQLQGLPLSTNAGDNAVVIDNVTGNMKTVPRTHTLSMDIDGNTLISTVNGMSANVPIVTENEFTSSGAQLISSVNGQVSKLTPVSGLINDVIGFSTTGDLVKTRYTVMPVTDTLFVSGNALKMSVNGFRSNTVNVVTANDISITPTGLLSTSVNGVSPVSGVYVMTNAENGLTKTNGVARLGGSLSAPTIIDVANNPFAIKGLPLHSSVTAASDEVVLTDINGNLAKAPIGNLLNLTPGLSNNGINTMTSSLNGVDKTASIVNTVSNVYNSTTNSLKTVVNGVSGDDVVFPFATASGAGMLASNDWSLFNNKIGGASDGLTKNATTGVVELGGSLSKNIAINTLGKDLKITGLLPGDVTSNNFVVADGSGALKTITYSTFPITGDVTGTLINPTVVKIQNKNISATAPNDGQVLKYNTVNTQWEPTTIATVEVGAANSTLRWDGIANKWAKSTALINDDATITANANFTQSGSGTFTTGTGAVALKGATTIDGTTTLNNNLTQSGSGAFTTGTGAVSLNGATALHADATLAAGKKMIFTGVNSGTVGLVAPATITTNYELILPDAKATLAGQVLTSKDANGNLGWSSVAPVEAGTANNNTLRWDGSKWATSTALSNDGTDITATGDVAVNGGDLTTNKTTATVFNSVATDLSIGGAATVLNLGAATGTTTVKNALSVNGTTTLTGATTLNNNFTQYGTATFTTGTGAVALNGDVTVATDKNFIQSGAGTFTTGSGAVTINGAATLTKGKLVFNDKNATANTASIKAPDAITTSYSLTLPLSIAAPGQVLTSTDANGNLGWSSVAPVEAGTANNNTLRWDGSKWATTTALSNDGTDIIATGDVAVNGGDLTTNKTTATVFNSVATDLSIGGAATVLNLGAATGTTTVKNALSVNGTTTLTGATTLNNNFTQSGTGTFTTGTGAVALNGDVTVAADKNFTQFGTGSFTTGTGAVTLKGATTSIDGATTIKGTATLESLPAGASDEDVLSVSATGIVHKRTPGVSAFKKVSADYVITLADNTIVLAKDATADRNFTLPTADVVGRTFRIVNMSAYKILLTEQVRTAVDITTNQILSGNAIDGTVLGNKMTILWDGDEWIQVGN